MLETPHVLVGIAIATKVVNPWLAIPLSFASHFILDMTPHWNPHFYTETKKYGKPKKVSTLIVVVDEVIAIVTTLYFAYSYLPDTKMSLIIMLCAFASVIPDQIKFPYFFFNQRQKYLTKWIDFERKIQVEIKPFWGIISQIIVIVASIYWIY